MPNVLVFPDTQHPFGVVEVAGHDAPLPAVGRVEIPDGPRVSLTIELQADLGFMAGFPPSLVNILRFGHPGSGDRDLEPFRGWTALERMILVNTSVTDEGMLTIAEISSLERLFLDGTSVTDLGVSRLAGLALKRLSLNNTSIGDDALETIATMPSITHIMCSGTGVTDRGLAHLAKMEQLGLLDVSETEVTGEGLVDLPRSPALVVLCEGPKVLTENLMRTRHTRPDLILNGVRHWTPPENA